MVKVETKQFKDGKPEEFEINKGKVPQTPPTKERYAFDEKDYLVQINEDDKHDGRNEN